DGDDVFVFRVDRKLDVATASEITDSAHHLDGLIAHFLVATVAERHTRCHGNRIAGMDTHRVEVFDGADDDYVICIVAQQLQFELFPSQYRLLYQYLVCGRSLQSTAKRRL